MSRTQLLLLLLPSFPGIALIAAEGKNADSLALTARSRVPVEPGSSQFRETEKSLHWQPKQTAIVICDMWDQHWCKGATQRVAEMAPKMNAVVKAARAQGVLI